MIGPCSGSGADAYSAVRSPSRLYVDWCESPKLCPSSWASPDTRPRASPEGLNDCGDKLGKTLTKLNPAPLWLLDITIHALGRAEVNTVVTLMSKMAKYSQTCRQHS